MSNPTPPPKILNDSDDDDDDHSNDDSSQGMPKEEEGEEEETASPQRVLRGGMPSASLISARAPPPPSIMYTPGTSDRIREEVEVYDEDDDYDDSNNNNLHTHNLAAPVEDDDQVYVPDSFLDEVPPNKNLYGNDAAIFSNAIANDYNQHEYSGGAIASGGGGGGAYPPGVTATDAHEDAMMRMLAFSLRRNWVDGNKMSPELERRLHDFRLAQKKRRERYGNERPWGILGLYEHLAGIRADVEWAEDAAWRRENGEPYLAWSDFEDCRDSGFNRPFFTIIILVVCTATLIASIGINGWRVESFSSNPMIGPSAETLTRMGAKVSRLIVIQGEWFRLFSPMILHAGLIHYLLNMLALWFIGSAVEQNHGFVAAAIIFIIPAAGGTIFSAIFLPEYISVGASGGIFGLIGACFADIVINWRLLFSKQVNSDDSGTTCRHIIVVVWLIVDIIINCVIGLTPYVDNFTHMGGMLYGFLCGLSTMERLSSDFFGIPTNLVTRLRNVLCRFMGLILSVVLIMVTTALLVESDGMTSPCPNCRYASCVKFPPWNADDNKWWYCDDCTTVTASLPTSESTGFIESITLTCPDGALEFIDLSDEEITDREFLSRQLPNYCREYCSNLFK
uniref:rhomboid protease n=2 Tax=Ditylum brightwellii TaxID=49249 RepID=A0A6V2QST7_9STRA|mmetsp:Transcript_15214/g.20136  ORF Transcript_15214/g.20136 Transcript_15214/m.20136 type:complete len:621 (-) Transcript_15214:134-1996(-)